MKKALLSVAAIAATVLTGWANEYTFVFDGNNDMGGLTRQTSTNPDELTFSEGLTLNEEGVEFSIRNTVQTGKGFALVNAGGSNAGILIYASISSTTSMSPQISLTVPNGKITEAKLYMSGTGLITLDVDFNGAAIESQNEGALYSWTWSDKEGTETLSMGWVNNYSSRYIHKIELTYSPDLGGKQECGLSFSSKTYEVILGETFKAPSLKNPNNLDVSWSSSDESVASVDSKGAVTPVGRGTATITAATEGNDEFAAGNAKYELTVIPSASNIAQLLEYAPSVYDRVKVNFPATVNFANGSIAFVTDSEGNAACFDDMRNRNSTSTTITTIYSVGQVIPAGWIAANATIYESVIWEGLPEKSTETVEVVYPKVNSVTPADADRVMILKNVTFETRTADGFEKAFGTTPDGTRYEFQDTYEVSSKPAGTYDVTCVVRYSKRGSTEYFFLAPVAYGDPSGADEPEQPTDPVFPDHLDYTLNGEAELPGVTVKQQLDGVTNAINFTGECESDKLTITFATPEGWDSMMMLDFFGFGEITNTPATRAEEDWTSVENALAQGFKAGNTITYDADGEDNFGYIALVKGDKVYLKYINFSVNVSTDGGVEPGTEDPIVPESLIVTVINDEGLVIEQDKEDGGLTISLSGITEDKEVYLILDVPEGWDGFISCPYDEDIEIGESSFNPRNTRAQEIYWVPVEDLLEDGFIKGNRFTFKPVDHEQTVETYLYKGEEANMLYWINILVNLQGKSTSVEAVDKADYARYYDLHGNVTTTSKAGVYIKIGEDGKVSKIMVK